MSYRQIFLTVNIETGQLVDPDNTTRPLSANERPSFPLMDLSILCLSFIDRDGAAVALDALAVFELAIDNNFLHTDALIAYSDTDDVDVAGDWADADRATGKVSIRVNTNTVSAAAKIGTEETLQPYLQIYLTPPGETDATTVLNAKCWLANRVKDTEGAPVSGDPEYYNATQVDALVAAKAGHTITAAAAEIIHGHRAAWITADGVYHASSDIPASAPGTLGIAANAAEIAADVQVRVLGEMTEPTWNWTPGVPVYVGVSGALTQTPPAVGYIREIALAVTATTVLIRPMMPITLAA